VSRSRRAEDGQVTAEYVGVGALVAVLVTGLLALAPGVSARVADTAATTLCRIGQPVTGAGCPGADGAAPEGARAAGSPALTPRERAEAGDYVALGDSYSSGEGAYDYQPGTDTDTNSCHRSANAYGQEIYDSGDFAGDFHFGACSGGVVEDYFGTNRTNPDEPPQRDAITEDTSLVTVTMGGNDFGFADVLRHCFTTTRCDTEAYRRQLRQTVEEQAAELVEMYRDMRARAGDDARIIVVGYPHLFVDDPARTWRSVGIGAEERAFLNEMADTANTAIQDAVAEADVGVEYVDIRDDFAGHEVGSADPWIHVLTLQWRWGQPLSPASFHPTDRGHDAIRGAVTEQIDEGP